MRFQLLSVIAAASAVTAQSSTVAPAVSDNPAGASYVATLPEQAERTVRGSVVATTNSDGPGVKFTVSISGLPAEGGPFMYHLHAKPVPSDGNCTGAGAHIDPYVRGEVPICDASKPDTCQTGDLSGKFGNITTQEWSQEYVDPYSSTNPSDPSYFGDLSLVVHTSNKTRIACANFTRVETPEEPEQPYEPYEPYPSDTPTPSSVSTGVPYPTEGGHYNTTLPTGTAAPAPVAPSSTSSASPPEFTGAASKLGGSALAAVFALAALAL
jgi:Cu/Zn superoxide dismutase